MFQNMSLKTCRRLLAIVSLLLVLVLCLQGLYSAGIMGKGSGQGGNSQSGSEEIDSAKGKADPKEDPEANPKADSEQMGAGNLSHEGYSLEKVVILSRHNIRSPLSGSGSDLDRMTPHSWFDWSSNPSELSLRGGALETEMGQYFRKWLEQEKLFPENYDPEGEAVRIYANSKQRTIATADYFSAGLLPVSDETVEYHMDLDEMDPVFNPCLTFTSDSYVEAAKKQIKEMYADDIEGLKDNYELISEVIDLKESEAYKAGDLTGFAVDDTDINLEKGEEPSMAGSLKTACSISDALILQYYEEKDPSKAAFGHDLTLDQWKDIGWIKDVYTDVLFTVPLVSANVAHPLLKEIKSELTQKDRIFTFLCGHDSNISSVLAALDAEEYAVPDAAEQKTPIGSKLVFCRWKGSDGKNYISIDLVYQTPDQLRSLELLDLNQHPSAFSLSLKNLKKNKDGLYEEKDVMDRLDQSIQEYDKIVDQY